MAFFLHRGLQRNLRFVLLYFFSKYVHMIIKKVAGVEDKIEKAGNRSCDLSRGKPGRMLWG